MAVPRTAQTGTTNVSAGAAAVGDRVYLFALTDTLNATLVPPADGQTWTEIDQGSEAGGAASTAGGWWADMVGSVPATFTVTGATIAVTKLFILDPDGDTFGTPDAPAMTTDITAVVGTITSPVVNAAAVSFSIFAYTADDQSTVTVAPPLLTEASAVSGTGCSMALYYAENANDATFSDTLTWSTGGTERMCIGISQPVTAGGASAALTGTVTSSTIEQDIRTGGKTIILTLTADTFVAAGATFDAQRQAIINGIDSGQAEAAGWDAIVKAGLAVTTVVRTSDTVCTITLSAFAAFQITATETITATIPAAALTLAGALVASPTFTVTRGADDLVQPVGATNASGVPATSGGSLTSDVAGLSRITMTVDAVTSSTVHVITKR